MLPYYIINYEKELSAIASDSAKSALLIEEYQNIIHKLDIATQTDYSGIFQDIMNMIRHVINYLLRKEPALKERIGDVMGGKILPLPSDKLREARAEGLSQGLSEGLSQGLTQGIIALINTCKALNATRDITLERLKSEFSLSDKQANEAIAKYWK